jgi:hypothetical protein
VGVSAHLGNPPLQVVLMIKIYRITSFNVCDSAGLLMFSQSEIQDALKNQKINEKVFDRLEWLECLK